MNKYRDFYWSRNVLLAFWLVVFCWATLFGCATTKEAPPTVSKTEQVDEIKLPRPAPQDHREVLWYVFSDDERGEVLRVLREEQAFMCVTPRGYENLSQNMSEVRRWTRQMIELVRQYEERASDVEANPRK